MDNTSKSPDGYDVYEPDNRPPSHIEVNGPTESERLEATDKIRRALEAEWDYNETSYSQVDFFKLAEQIIMDMRHEAERKL